MSLAFAPTPSPRILVREIPAVFRRNRLTPVRHRYGGHLDGCGCLLIALLVDAGHGREAFNAAARTEGIGRCLLTLAEERLGFTKPYSAGLIRGWDDELPSGNSADDEAGDLLIGICDARSAWDAVMADRMPIQEPRFNNWPITQPINDLQRRPA